MRIEGADGPKNIDCENTKTEHRAGSEVSILEESAAAFWHAGWWIGALSRTTPHCNIFIQLFVSLLVSHNFLPQWRLFMRCVCIPPLYKMVFKAICAWQEVWSEIRYVTANKLCMGVWVCASHSSVSRLCIFGSSFKGKKSENLQKSPVEFNNPLLHA